VDSLPEGHRHTLIMADLQDMSYREIAERLDCPLGTVMSRLHRSRRLMRVALEGQTSVAAFG
jgi:RNA polymerase sigma-70 factor (ECF subfamily)